MNSGDMLPEGEAAPGPYLLPYMDEEHPETGVLWLNAEEWERLLCQQNPSTSRETLPKEVQPQRAVTCELRSEPQRLHVMPLSKKTMFIFRYKTSARKSQLLLFEPMRWKDIQMVIFGEDHGLSHVQYWDIARQEEMLQNSVLVWKSDNPTLRVHKWKEAVSVTVYRYDAPTRPLWCEVASLVTLRKLFIVEPKSLWSTTNMY